MTYDFVSQWLVEIQLEAIKNWGSFPTEITLPAILFDRLISEFDYEHHWCKEKDTMLSSLATINGPGGAMKIRRDPPYVEVHE